jgi:hypothetical protein
MADTSKKVFLGPPYPRRIPPRPSSFAPSTTRADDGSVASRSACQATAIIFPAGFRSTVVAGGGRLPGLYHQGLVAPVGQEVGFEVGVFVSGQAMRHLNMWARRWALA